MNSENYTRNECQCLFIGGGNQEEVALMKKGLQNVALFDTSIADRRKTTLETIGNDIKRRLKSMKKHESESDPLILHSLRV